METLERTPRLREKLFTEVERELPPASLAARFAAKEAIAKSLGAPGNLRWHDVTVHRTVGGPPRIDASGTVAARAAELGVRTWHITGLARRGHRLGNGDRGRVIFRPRHWSSGITCFSKSSRPLWS